MSKCLVKTPQKAVVIAIVREPENLESISQLESVQPNINNIWLISARPLRIPNLRNYSVSHMGLSKRFCDIIIDIEKFLRKSGDKSMRFVHS